MSAALTAVLIVLGGAFACVAGVGILRMPDVYNRMHAATKAGTLGVGLIVAAVAVHFGDGTNALRAATVFVFLLITAPVAAHLIGRAAYRSGVPLWRGGAVDAWQTPEGAPGSKHHPNEEKP